MKALDTSLDAPVSVPDSDKVAASFSRSAASYDAHAGVQRRVAQDLLARLEVAQDEMMLDVGSGTGCHTYALSQSGATVKGVDIAPGMVNYAASRYPALSFCQGHAESLPFHAQTFHQVFSSMALQWCHSPLQAMSEIHRVLKKGGRASLAIMVDGSFEELDRARRVAGMSVTTNPQASHTRWCEAAARAGFTVRQASLIPYVDHHKDILSLLRSIKHTGAGVTTTDGAPLNRQDLKKLSMTYQSLHGDSNTFPLTYNISQLIIEK